MAAAAAGGREDRRARGAPAAAGLLLLHPGREVRLRERRCTGARMVAWPRPQSSVQMSVKVPVRVGVITMLVSMPGTRSCF